MAKGRPLAGVVSGKKFPPLMYGLVGIMELFNVGKTTAHRYKTTFLAPAITQQGNNIVIDVREALRLFGLKNPDAFIRHEKKEEV